jgi:hypothetical protein
MICPVNLVHPYQNSFHIKNPNPAATEITAISKEVNEIFQVLSSFSDIAVIVLLKENVDAFKVSYLFAMSLI